MTIVTTRYPFKN